MAEIRILYGGLVHNMSSMFGGAFADPPSTLGKARLNIRINSTLTSKFGFTTNSTASQYCKLNFMVGGKRAWIGTWTYTFNALTNSQWNSLQTVTDPNLHVSTSTPYIQQRRNETVNGQMSTWITTKYSLYSTTQNYTHLFYLASSDSAVVTNFMNGISSNGASWTYTNTAKETLWGDTPLNGTAAWTIARTSQSVSVKQNIAYSYWSSMTWTSSYRLTKRHDFYKFYIRSGSPNFTSTSLNITHFTSLSQRIQALGGRIGNNSMWVFTHTKSTSGGAYYSSRYADGYYITELYSSTYGAGAEYTNINDTFVRKPGGGYISNVANSYVFQFCTGNTTATSTTHTQWKYGLWYVCSWTANYKIRYTNGGDAVNSVNGNITTNKTTRRTLAAATQEAFGANPRHWSAISNLQGITIYTSAWGHAQINRTYSSKLISYSGSVTLLAKMTYFKMDTYFTSVVRSKIADTNNHNLNI